jgi:hypothetical protein
VSRHRFIRGAGIDRRTSRQRVAQQQAVTVTCRRYQGWRARTRRVKAALGLVSADTGRGPRMLLTFTGIAEVPGGTHSSMDPGDDPG